MYTNVIYVLFIIVVLSLNVFSMKNESLKEKQEQLALVGWLRMKGLHFAAINQELPRPKTPQDWGFIARAKQAGMTRGIPDLMCIVPWKGEHNLVFIELKRTKGGRLSPEQADWQKWLNSCTGVGAYVAYGADEAIKLIESLMGI